MPSASISPEQILPNGVMLNAYPDSIGGKLADIIGMLKREEFKDVFSLFYILPTFFNSDLDRGFSVIDYNINQDLVSPTDIRDLRELGIQLKFDFVLNHLSVQSPQFRDVLTFGDNSPYRDFFIDWDEFWKDCGDPCPDGYIIPRREFLKNMFTRKAGLPILKVRFPDGSERPYWNTFYQEVRYHPLDKAELTAINGISGQAADVLLSKINTAIANKDDHKSLDFGEHAALKDAIVNLIESKRTYLGQMDLNAESDQVWEFYDETLGKLGEYGAKIIRLDAFAYLHKKQGEVNFFNRPGTWDYLERLRAIASKYNLVIFPEVHAEYGAGLHEEIAGHNYPLYDFFFPGLVIDALERGTSKPLRSWIDEVIEKNIKTINMLGCHDGIPVLDLKSKEIGSVLRPGLLEDDVLEATVNKILERGGRVKNLFGADGKKISYYQVNATFFSALGEDESKLLLARAIQLFMPGIPQIWYLDLFAGKNDYYAADHAGTAGHKEINRTNLSRQEIEARLQHTIVKNQLKLLRLRNTSPAFRGTITVNETEDHILEIVWKNGTHTASLSANLHTMAFTVEVSDGINETTTLKFGG